MANPHRLRIVAALHAHGRNYVSRLARDLQIGRPLLHLHLQKLEEAGLVESRLELCSDGKGLNFYQLANFELRLDPASIAMACVTLSASSKPEP